jgi:hypothetical protein
VIPVPESDGPISNGPISSVRESDATVAAPLDVTAVDVDIDVTPGGIPAPIPAAIRSAVTGKRRRNVVIGTCFAAALLVAGGVLASRVMMEARSAPKASASAPEAAMSISAPRPMPWVRSGPPTATSKGTGIAPPLVGRE